MNYRGVLKTKYVIDKVKSLPKKLKKIYEIFFAIIMVIVLAIVVLVVIIGTIGWFLKEFFGVVI